MKPIVLIFLLTMVILRGEDLHEAPWPPKNVDFVVGYCYDYTQDPRGGSPVFPDGSLNRGIIQSATVRLSQQQQEGLLKTVTSPIEFEDSEDCHYPHHAFVFYDAKRNPVGWISVCLECGNYYFSSKNAPEYISMKDLYTLCADLKMPSFAEHDDYINLFRQEQPEGDRAAVKTWKEILAAQAGASQKETAGDDPFAAKDKAKAGTEQPGVSPESSGDENPKPESKPHSEK